MTSPSKKLTGGPAFPRAGNEWSDMQWVPAPDQAGMTLRDYFAAKAMAAMLPEYELAYVFDEEWCDEGETPMIGHIARDAYIAADAMLKAREA